MADSRLLIFPVTDPDGRTTGVVTLARLAAVPCEVRSTTRLGDVQVPLEQIVIVPPETSLSELQRLGADEIALVVDGGRRVGLITGYDVARATRDRQRS